MTRYFQFQSIDIHSSKGRVGVGLSLSEPTYLKHCQNTYLPVGVGSGPSLTYE